LAAPEQSPATPKIVLGPDPEPNTIVLVIVGPIARADVPDLCKRARTLLEGSEADLVLCDVGALANPDVVAIDMLARLQLTARSLGRRVQVERAGTELKELITLVGLAAEVPCGDLPFESWRQAEEREKSGRVEEERDSGEPLG
jgi:ABC-type transporter Mla MlaB component